MKRVGVQKRGTQGPKVENHAEEKVQEKAGKGKEGLRKVAQGVSSAAVRQVEKKSNKVLPIKREVANQAFGGGLCPCCPTFVSLA